MSNGQGTGFDPSKVKFNPIPFDPERDRAERFIWRDEDIVVMEEGEGTIKPDEQTAS